MMSVLAIALVVILLVFQFRIVKSWTKPADWYLLWSCALIAYSVLLAYPDYKWDGMGAFWWLGSCFACSVCSVVGEKINLNNSRVLRIKAENKIARRALALYFTSFIGFAVIKNRINFQFKWQEVVCWVVFSLIGVLLINLIDREKTRVIYGKINEVVNKIISPRVLVFLYLILGLLYSVLLLKNNGFSIFEIKTMSDLFEINNYMQGYRYSNLDVNEDWLQQICLSFTYALPLCGGILLVNAQKLRTILICLITLLPHIVITLLNNTKSGIIIAIILFVAAFLIEYLRRYSKSLELRGKVIAILIGTFFFFLVFVFFAIRLRYNSYEDRSSTSYILQTLNEYIFGCTVNFDYFFEKIKNMDLSKSYNYVQGSNILTANTFWIQDYGYIGTIILWGIRGLFSGISYENVRKGENTVLDILILLYVYLNAIYFFTYIPFSYMTVVIGVFVWFTIFFEVYVKGKGNIIKQKI